jgi:predicted phage tail protein
MTGPATSRRPLTDPRRRLDLRERRVPRVSGRKAAAGTALGIASMVAAFFVPYGVVIFIAGVYLIGGSLALWLVNRYGVLDAIERSADWMRSAPARKPPSDAT